MKYQDDKLSEQHDALSEKYLKCKKYESHADSLSDIEYIKNSENELSLFEERFLHEPMVFEEEEFPVLLPIIKDNFKDLKKPAYFRFENGMLRRPVINNEEEKEIVEHILTPRIGGFTGRVFVYNWPSVDVNNLAKNKVTVSIERSSVS